MLRSVSSSVQGFLNSVNRIHLNLQIALPELLPPDLLTLRCPDDPSALLLLYRSKRQGLGALTQGVVKASAREFVGVEVRVVDQGSTIPSYVDASCPSVFRETFASVEQQQDEREDEDDEKIAYNNVQLFRITTVDPASTRKLFDDDDLTKSSFADDGEKVVCPFSGQVVSARAIGGGRMPSQRSLAVWPFASSSKTSEEETASPPRDMISFDDFEKIFQFYIILSGTLDDRLRVDQLGPGIARDGDFFAGRVELHSDQLFQFFAPPLQHKFSDLKRNVDTPLTISIRNPTLPNNTNNGGAVCQNRRFLFKAIELSPDRMLLYGAPDVRSLTQLEGAGLHLTELSPETKDLLCLTEHFVAEVSSSNKLDQANKALVREKKKQLTVTMNAQLRKGMIMRWFFILAVFGLDLSDLWTDWLGLRAIRGTKELAYLNKPYVVFLVIVTTYKVVMLSSTFLDLGKLACDLFRNKTTTEAIDFSNASYEAKSRRLDELNDAIKTGVFILVTAVLEDVTAIVLSAVALNTLGENSRSPLFISMCISLVLLGFKLRTIETVVSVCAKK